MAMFGVLSFLPLFVQVVLGTSATAAGRVLTPMMLSMMVTSAIGARFVLRIGFRVVVTTGAVLTALGTYLMTTLTVSSSQLDVSIDMLFLGAGMGFVFMSTSLAAQNSVDASPHGCRDRASSTSRASSAARSVWRSRRR